MSRLALRVWVLAMMVFLPASLMHEVITLTTLSSDQAEQIERWFLPGFQLAAEQVADDPEALADVRARFGVGAEIVEELGASEAEQLAYAELAYAYAGGWVVTVPIEQGATIMPSTP